MLILPQPKVLILARNPQSARRWAEMLSGAADVWISTAEIPAGQQADVVVTDLPSAAQAELACQLPLGIETTPKVPGTSAAGVIGIGGPAWADVLLDENCSPGELRLACRLLAEIAQLRAARVEAARRCSEMAAAAETDPLTGLGNRRAWQKYLAGMQTTNAPHEGLWLAIIDLDRFKEVNESLGLTAADALLQAAAEAMRVVFRKEDSLIRWGGDEFVAVIDALDEQAVTELLERVRRAVADHTQRTGTRLTASIGYAATAKSTSLEALFIAAETALRQAKLDGGDRIVRGEPGN